VQPFGSAHIGILTLITALSTAFALLYRRRLLPDAALRLGLPIILALTELLRYRIDGLGFPDRLPLQLCDLNVWVAVLACATRAPLAVEFVYFAGTAGAMVALVTPNVSEWTSSYDIARYFVTHGGIVLAACTLVFGRVIILRDGAMWRAFWLSVLYMALVGVFDARFGSNYFFLREKPASVTLLDVMGPWPLYLGSGILVGLTMYWLLWLPVRPKRDGVS